MSFVHYIVTRFNLPVSSRPAGESKAACGKEYLSYRFGIFENYCLPSVRRQSCQGFKWIILFDADTPEEFRKRAEGWHLGYPNLIPCYLDVDEYGGLASDDAGVTDVDTDVSMLGITEQFVTDTIRSLEAALPDWVLTTRLDNDDALHRGFVRSVQESFTADPRPVAYDFVNTYKCVLDERVVYRYQLKNGHFITLAERPDQGFRSVLFCNHLEMDRHVETVHIDKSTIQAELIHGGNVVNGYTDLSLGGLLYAFVHFRKGDFGYEGFRYSRFKALWMAGSLAKQRFLRKWGR